MLSLSENDYEKIKKFISFYIENTVDLSKVPQESRPFAQFELLEKKNRRRAVAGVMQALNDCLSMSMRLAPVRVRELDTQLREQGLPTLSELRAEYSKEYAKIIARGRIRNETEYYLVKEALEDSHLDDVGMVKAQQMIDDFEGAQNARPSQRD